MSVSIRLARVGKKHAPAYKIVVANTRDKRNGRFLDILGHYNPSMNPPTYSLDEDKYSDWKLKGALSTKAVEKLRDGTYEFVPYEPKATGDEAETSAQSTTEASETTEETDTEEDAE